MRSLKEPFMIGRTHEELHNHSNLFPSSDSEILERRTEIVKGLLNAFSSQGVIYQKQTC